MLYVVSIAKKSKNGIYCTDKRIERSLFGFGARMCAVIEGGDCSFQEIYPKPNITHIAPQKPLPLPPKSRNIMEKVVQGFFVMDRE